MRRGIMSTRMPTTVTFTFADICVSPGYFVTFICRARTYTSAKTVTFTCIYSNANFVTATEGRITSTIGGNSYSPSPTAVITIIVIAIIWVKYYTTAITVTTILCSSLRRVIFFG